MCILVRWRRQDNPRVCSTVALLVTVIALTGLLASGVAADTTSVSDRPVAETVAAVEDSSSDTTNETTNATDRHQHPDEVGEDGDAEAIADWLSGDLADQLGESTVQLSEGEYDRARDHLGDDYDDRLGQLVDVAGDTDRQTDDGADQDEQAATEFEETKETQERFVDTVETYEETAEAYEEAKAQGDDEQARELARELEVLADQVDEHGTALDEHYTELGNLTGLSFTEHVTNIDQTRTNVVSTQAEIRTTEFRETTITVTAADNQASFLRPLELSGTVVDADGEPVPNTTVRVDSERLTTTTMTDADGEFAFAHRPTLLPVSTETVSVMVDPEPTSHYLPSEANVSVELTAETPTIQITTPSDTAAFGDTVSVNASMAVEDIPVTDVPVQLTLDDEQLEETRTDENGSVALSGTVPATVEPGDATLSVRFPQEGRALTNASTTTTVNITETETELHLSGTEQSPATVAVTGQLTTEAGTPVADEPIELTIDGTTMETVRADDEGRIETAVTVPDHVLANSEENVTVTLRATYTQPAGNLNDSSAETTVTVAVPGDGDESAQAIEDDSSEISSVEAILGWFTGGDGSGGGEGLTASVNSPVSWVLGGFAAILLGLWALTGAPIPSRVETVLGALVPFGSPETPSSSDSAQSTEESPVDSESSTSDGPAPELVTARKRIDEGDTDDAVVLAYEAARGHLAETIDYGQAQTHWEFFAAASENGLDSEAVTRLRTLTEGYEQAMFAPEDFVASEAEEAVDTATAITDH